MALIAKVEVFFLSEDEHFQINEQYLVIAFCVEEARETMDSSLHNFKTR